MFFIIKKASILDFKHNNLPVDIWEDDLKLKDNVRDFIYQQTIKFFNNLNIKGYEEFIKGCFIASSLGTYYYTTNTDFDIKFVIDCNSLKKYNSTLSLPSDNSEIIKFLITTGRDSKELTEIVPNTSHKLDCYFYEELEEIYHHLIKYDSLYSVGRNTWIKQPTTLPDDFSPDFILQRAKKLSQPYIDLVTKDFEKLRIDSIDFILLKDFIKNIDIDSSNKFKYYIEKQIELIDDDLDKLVEDKDLLKRLRRNSYNKSELVTQLEKIGKSLNYSEGNLIFKILQRYGYLDILHELAANFENNEFSEDDLPLLLSIVNKR